MYVVLLSIMTHRGCWTLPVLMTVVLMSHFSEVTGAHVSATPSQINLGGQNPTTKLTVTCQATSSFTVVTLQIGKVVSGVNNAIVLIVTGQETQIVDTSLQGRMTYSGSISGITGNLQITLTILVCSDADYPYYCSETYINQGSKESEDAINTTSMTYPQDMTMTVHKHKIQYNVGDLVEFNCHGLIGNQFNENNMAGYWTWQWRTVGSSTSQWTIYPNANNISYVTPTIAANCQYNASSTLSHTVTLLDNGRQFRCYVLNNPDYGGNKTVYTEIPPVTDRPCNCGGEKIDLMACQYTPNDFYCTQHTQSSVTLQWIYTGIKYSSFWFDFQFRHAKETHWNPVNISEQNTQLQPLHAVKVTQLQSDSLIYFRLSAGGGQAGQCESVTVTCFTRDESSEDTSSYFLGVGTAIGIVVMLLCGGLCFLIAFIYRRKVASGGVTNKKPATVNLHQRPAPLAAETETNPTADGEYEMPGNFYDGLQERRVDVPTTYDELRTYQNI